MLYRCAIALFQFNLKVMDGSLAAAALFDQFPRGLPARLEVANFRRRAPSRRIYDEDRRPNLRVRRYSRSGWKVHVEDSNRLVIDKHFVRVWRDLHYVAGVRLGGAAPRGPEPARPRQNAP